ncbi:MAG: Gfo/Idh/MocA family protein, partial [Candidatus Nanopelagicales bacterium]
GGALFDWGSHIVDQILDLMPGDVDAVSAVNHKRVWHDVTNADHARMTLHFTDGREASFVYSDLAAALKPRWYVLGTHGAITGEWRQESVVTRSPIGTLTEDVLAPADSPPRVLVHSPSGDVTAMAPPAHEPHPFHSDLALGLRYGLLPRVRGVQSRRVVAMLQAAEESAALGGQPVKPS